MAKTKERQDDKTLTTPQEGEPALQGSEQSGAGRGQAVQTTGAHSQSGELQERRQGGAVGRFGRDPFEMMQRLSDEMDELFDSVFYGRPVSRGRGQSRLSNLWAPEVEIAEEGDRLRVCVDLPGVSKDDLKVDVREGVLTIEGERREQRSEGGADRGYRRSERRYGRFYRSIPLPEGADADKAEAHMKDGVLEITVPVATKQARRLEIRS